MILLGLVGTGETIGRVDARRQGSNSLECRFARDLQ
jgi:hypothetical protein